jgi:DNA-binding response OmpR family regulator
MPHVLLIEDDPALRLALHDFLVHSGFQVSLDAAGDAAAIDIIVCDYRLPGQTGTELIMGVRTRTGRSIPAIVLTGDSGLQAERDTAALGRAKFLLKPVRMEVLVAEVRALLNAAQ